jgi:hypothetical protein
MRTNSNSNLAAPQRSPSMARSTRSNRSSLSAVTSLFRRVSGRSGPIDKDWEQVSVAAPQTLPETETLSVFSAQTRRSTSRFSTVGSMASMTVGRSRSSARLPHSSSQSSLNGARSSLLNSNASSSSLGHTSNSTYGLSLAQPPSRSRVSLSMRPPEISRLGASSSSSISGRRRNGGGSPHGHSSSSPYYEGEDPFAEASSEALRREIASIENGRQRLVNSFLELEESARAKRQPPPEALAAAAGPPIHTYSAPPSRPPPQLSSSPSLLLRKSSKSSKVGDRSSRVRLPTLEVRPPSGTEEDDQELVRELEVLRDKRLAVEARYEDRLNYLRAKLQGALIRERLPK